MDQSSNVQIRTFTKRDQQDSRTCVLNGLKERFGCLDVSLNQDLNNIQENYLENGDLFLVAEKEGKIVGTLGILFGREKFARLVRLSVLKPYRRSGIARRLIADAEERIKGKGVSKVLVATEHPWNEATSLYESTNYKKSGEDEVDVHFSKDLLC